MNPESCYVEVDAEGCLHQATFGDLAKRAETLCKRLSSGPKRDAAVAVLCFDQALDYVVAAWACLFAGVDLLAWEAPGLAFDHLEYERRLLALLEGLDRPLILTEGNFPRRLRQVLRAPVKDINSNSDWPQLSDAQQSIAAKRPSSILVATSGTGGEPKLARLDNASLITRFYDGEQDLGRLCQYNLAHHSVAGLRLLLPLDKGVVYFHPLALAANPIAWLQSIERHGVTDVGVSNSIAAMLSQAMEEADTVVSLASLKRLSVGAEMISPGVLKKFLAGLLQWGASQLQVTLVYSMTETGPLYYAKNSAQAFVDSLDPAQGICFEQRAAGWQMRCVNDQGKAVGVGEAGHLQVYSEDKLFSGYHGQDRVGRTDDGWFDTGDIGRLEGGKLSLLGRAKTTLVINARKVTSEAIEARLSQSEGLESIQMWVAPYRSRDSVTDQLAVFFVDKKASGGAADQIASRIAHCVSRDFRLKVSAVVPVHANEVDRTATLKVRRHRLAEKLQDGQLHALASDTGAASVQPSIAPDDLRQLWRQQFGLERLPGWEEDFFALGGDSLDAVRLLAAVERRFKVRLAAQAFFASPTPRHMQDLLQAAAGSTDNANASAIADAGATGLPLTARIKRFVDSWRGTRRWGGSLLVGFNTLGRKPPLIWVFQARWEASKLAEHLGPDQPLYAFRSLVEILPTANYKASRLEPVIDRYLWELLAVVEQAPFRLGGNCQGAIIALYLARRLRAIGRTPLLLDLMEWSFDHGSFDGKTRFLLGEATRTNADPAALDRQFRDNRVCSLVGKHGQYFSDPRNLSRLADLLANAN